MLTHIKAGNAAQSLIRKKENNFFEERLKANTENLKKAWKTRKQLALDSKNLLPPIFS